MWTLACARGYADGISGIGWQRGCVAGNAAFPPQDPEEEVPLRCACAVCAAGGCGAGIFEYFYLALIYGTTFRKDNIQHVVNKIV